MNNNIIINEQKLLQSIMKMIDSARNEVAVQVNYKLTVLYWNIGKKINDDILKNNRADYGKKIVSGLSSVLTQKYGNNFGLRNLLHFIKFHTIYPDLEIVNTLCTQFSWSHLRQIIYIKDELKREFYIQLCSHERWSVRTLQERIESMLFERTAISKNPEQTILKDLKKLNSEKQISADLTFRDPYFLDFLGLKDTYCEKDLETSILINLQNFIIEFGSEFAFIARQKRIVIDNENFYIDLLFYHRGLKCIVAIDLKLDKFKAAYKGQMELYLRWLEVHEQKEGENKPIGLILCSEKSPEQINYLLLDNNEQIKIAEYLTKLPDKKFLQMKLQKAIAIAKNKISLKQ